MLIQASSPRPLFTLERYPEYVYIQTVAKQGVSSGEVYFNATVDPSNGIRATKALDPSNIYDLHDGIDMLEYVLPFWELFKRDPSKAPSAAIMRTTGAERYADRAAVPYATGGFNITIRSAFRADRVEYEERTIVCQLLFPVTGGGILRLGDSFYDLANPTFDPWAPNPKPRKNLDAQKAFERAHQPTTQAIEERRAKRIQEAEESMALADAHTSKRLLPKR